MEKIMSNCFEILKKYSCASEEVLKKCSTIQELSSISFSDILSLSCEQFNEIPPSLFYAWIQLTQDNQMSEKIDTLVNKYKPAKEKIASFKQSPLFSKELENVLSEIVKNNTVSATFIQRIFCCSYPKARSYLEKLEYLGFIEPKGCRYNLLISASDFE